MDFKQFYKTINFDIDNEIRTVFQATQGDTKSRGLLVDLIVGGVKTPVTTETIRFFALKPDGTRVVTQGVKDGTGFRIDFTNQTFAVAGVLLCTLVLSGTNGEKIADKKFKMNVDSTLEDGAIISEDERGILDRAFDLASDIVPRLEGLDVPLLENLEQRIDSIITTPVPTGEIIAQEIIDARQGADSLGANITEVKSQLAESAKDALAQAKRTFTKTSGYWEQKAFVTFIDDDAVGTPLFANIEPIFTSRGIPLSIACINSMNAMINPTQRQHLLDLQNNHGWEILSHGWDDKTFDSLTQEELEKNLADSVNDFQQKGFKVESAVYPQGGMSKLSKSITGKYFRAGFATSAVPTNVSGGIESMDNIDLYAIKRINIGDYPADIAYYRSAIDYAKANNQWLVFYTHSYSFGDGSPNIELLKDVVDYVITQGVEIVTPKKALDRYEPVLQVGNTDSYAGNTRLLKNGKMFGNYNLELLGGNNFKESDPISAYTNPLTIFAVTSDKATELGWGEICTIVTIKGTFSFGFDYQLKLSYNSNKIQMRRVMTTINEEWSTWTGLANDADVGATRLTDDFGTSATLIGQYPYNKISTFVSTSAGSGFPSGGIGYVTTYHFAVATWSRQEFRPRRTNEIWSRFVGADGQWTTWTLLETRGNGYGNTANRPTSGVADGYMYTDYELGKTIVKVGSNWKDTMGATVAPF